MLKWARGRSGKADSEAAIPEWMLRENSSNSGGGDPEMGGSAALSHALGQHIDSMSPPVEQDGHSVLPRQMPAPATLIGIGSLDAITRENRPADKATPQALWPSTEYVDQGYLQKWFQQEDTTDTGGPSTEADFSIDFGPRSREGTIVDMDGIDEGTEDVATRAGVYQVSPGRSVPAVGRSFSVDGEEGTAARLRPQAPPVQFFNISDSALHPSSAARARPGQQHFDISDGPSSAIVQQPTRALRPRAVLASRDLPRKSAGPSSGMTGREESDNLEDVDVDCLREAASEGDAEAQLQLGKLHLRGNLVPQDPERAWHLFELAASVNNSGAQFALGFMHELGLGGNSDDADAEAADLYRKAANQGHPTAMFGLATMLSQGKGGGHDEEEAFRWFRSAAELGDREAQWELGDRMLKGRGIPEDLEGAQLWWIKAADQGSPEAQTSLGSLFARGLGADGRDDKEALRWFGLAAWQYHAPGMKNLGDMYALGRGVESDDAEAVRWYKLAVEQDPDHVPALKALGNMYAGGRGVQKNTSQALHFFSMAAELRKAQVAREAEAAPTHTNQVSLEMGAGLGSQPGDSPARCAIQFSTRMLGILSGAISCQARSRKNHNRSRRGGRR